MSQLRQESVCSHALLALCAVHLRLSDGAGLVAAPLLGIQLVRCLVQDLYRLAVWIHNEHAWFVVSTIWILPHFLRLLLVLRLPLPILPQLLLRRCKQVVHAQLRIPTRHVSHPMGRLVNLRLAGQLILPSLGVGGLHHARHARRPPRVSNRALTSSRACGVHLLVLARFRCDARRLLRLQPGSFLFRLQPGGLLCGQRRQTLLLLQA
mmetsp:Transcript_1129/g.2340  ORF Transcript_1129/g.2340 Transcript_1129/m.2340 type:complete len:208 (-) Transcript_1129:865-1488(-)